jgi:hypothetical protein
MKIVESLAAALIWADLFVNPPLFQSLMACSISCWAWPVLWGVVLRAVHYGLVQEGRISAETI